MSITKVFKLSFRRNKSQPIETSPKIKKFFHPQFLSSSDLSPKLTNFRPFFSFHTLYTVKTSETWGFSCIHGVIERNHWPEMGSKAESRAKSSYRFQSRAKFTKLQLLLSRFFIRLFLFSPVIENLSHQSKVWYLADFQCFPSFQISNQNLSSQVPFLSSLRNVSNVGLSKQSPLLRCLPKCSSRIVVRFLYIIHKTFLTDK